jgi:hypothetical protein
MIARGFGIDGNELSRAKSTSRMLVYDTDCPLCNTQQRAQPPLALAVPLSRFASRVGDGSAFIVRRHAHTILHRTLGCLRSFGILRETTSIGHSGSLFLVAHIWYGDEMLDLKADGTYLEVLTTRTTSRTNSGTWQFQPIPRIVVLKSALIFDDGFGKPAAMIVTNDWTLNLTNILSIIMLDDQQAQPFSKD